MVVVATRRDFAEAVATHLCRALGWTSSWDHQLVADEMMIAFRAEEAAGTLVWLGSGYGARR